MTGAEFADLLERESLLPREDWEIEKKYRGYAIGAALTMWRQLVKGSPDADAHARQLLELLSLSHFANPIEPGTHKGYAWVRTQLRVHFNIKEN